MTRAWLAAKLSRRGSSPGKRGVRNRHRTSQLGVECLEGRRVLAGTALPVLENILRPPLARFGSNDKPEEFATVGGRLFFTAHSSAQGTELWAVDQGKPDASLVADIVSGTGSSFPRYLAQGRSRLFFVANDAQGEGVWQTDGTTAGTVRISTLPRAVTSIGKPVVIDGDRIVVAVSELVNGATVTSLWVMDGTTNGTQRLTAASFVRVSFDKPTVRGGYVYFSAATKFSSGGGGFWRGELWRTDGTPAGTIPVAAPSVSGSSPVSSTPPSQLTATDDGVYFVSDGPAIPFGDTGWQGGGADVWCYRDPDGTLVRVTDAKSDPRFHAYFHSLTPWKGRLFFAAQAEVVGLPWQMFVADGPTGEVSLLSTAPTEPSSLTAAADGVYFRVDTYDLSKGNLWRTDGTDAGTSRVAGSRWPTTSIALVNDTVYADSARRLARMAPDNSQLVELSQATVRFDPWSPMSGLGNGVYFWATGNSGFGIDTLYRYDLPASVPGSPSALQVVGGDGQVSVTWVAPSQDGGAAVTDYAVEYSSDGGSIWTSSIDGVSAATSATITGLANGTTYVFRVSAMNSVGRGAPSAISSPVTPVATVNGPPTDMLLSASSIAEGQAPASIVGVFSTTDQDVGDTFTYSLVSGAGSTDNALFTIVGNQLSTAVSFDYEARILLGNPSIRVRSTDKGGLWTEKVFTIVVTDINEVPTDIVLSATTVGDNQPAGTVVGSLLTRDADLNIRIIPLPVPAIFTYAFVAGAGDADNARFRLVRDGYRDVDELVTAAPLPAGTYSIRVRSTDPGGLWIEKTFTIVVASVNHAPAAVERTITFDGLAPDVDFREYLESGFVFTAPPGEVRITDAFSPGNNAAQPSFGFGQQMDSRLTLRAVDGRPFDLRRIDLQEATLTPEKYAVVVTGTHTDGSVVSHTLSLDGVAGGQRFPLPRGSWGFVMVPGTGIAECVWIPGFTDLVSVTIREATTNSFAIDIVQADNIVVELSAIGLSATVIQENQAAGAVVGTLSTTDADAGDSHAYSLVAGDGSADNAAFRIVGSQLQAVTPFDFESKRNYSIRVRSTDAGGLFAERSFTVVVSDVVEVPGPPMNVQGTAGDAEVRLSWTAPTFDGGAPISDYVIQYRTANDSSWTTLRRGPSTATTATVTGLVNGASYVFRVAASNAAGIGIPCMGLSAVEPRPMPGMPMGLAAVPGNGRVTLAWMAPAVGGGSPVVDYVIQFSSNSGLTWTTFADRRSASRSTVVTGLANGVGYVLRVAAVNAAGRGPFSAPSATVVPATFPGVPTGLAGTPGNRLARLTWAAPAFDGGRPITAYIIEMSSNSGRTWRQYATTTTTSVTVAGLTNGVSYVFRVVAVNSIGRGGATSRFALVRPRA